jgi:hypothetical protein
MMKQHSVIDWDSSGSAFYRDALEKLLDAKIPFLVGGAYALQIHTGIVRRTKDFDIFVLEKDAANVLQLLSQAGYNSELTFPHWLGKAFCGEDFIDVIFNSGNGVCCVDELWFQYAARGNVLGFDLMLCPVEETIWQKAFILERDRCDVADVAHLIRHCGQRMDWRRLLKRFAQRGPVLLAQLILFRFIYPGHHEEVPDWVLGDLMAQLAQQKPTNDNHVCHGTLLSATQYLNDVELEGYQDGRRSPFGEMSEDDVALWTANFMKPK